MLFSSCFPVGENSPQRGTPQTFADKHLLACRSRSNEGHTRGRISGKGARSEVSCAARRNGWHGAPHTQLPSWVSRTCKLLGLSQTGSFVGIVRGPFRAPRTGHSPLLVFPLASP